MKAFPVLPVLFVTCALKLTVLTLSAQSSPDQIRKMEASGDIAGARLVLARAVDANPKSVPALTAYAEFLDRYGDKGSRDAYNKLLGVLRTSGDRERTGVIARRLAILELLAGDREAAGRNLEAHRSASGKTVNLAAASAAPA